MFSVNKNPTRDDLRGFGTAMLIGFGAIGAVLWCVQWYRGEFDVLLSWAGTRSQILCAGLWVLGIALFSLSRVSLVAAKPVYVVWMSVTVPMGIVMATIMLTLLYFLLLPVFSLIVRSGDPLRKKLNKDGSYWEDHAPYEASLDRMRRMF